MHCFIAPLFRLKLGLLIPIAFSLSSCTEPDQTSTPPPPPAARESNVIGVKAAPFDVFPQDPRFGFSIRFSEPMVRRSGGREVTPVVTLTPAIAGTFRWFSDSELLFNPVAPLPAGSRYEVALDKLTLPKGKTLSETNVGVIVPVPQLAIAQCELREVSTNPVVKHLKVSLLLNHSLDGYVGKVNSRTAEIEKDIATRSWMKKVTGGEEEPVTKKQTIRDQTLNIEFFGNDMLRPAKDGVLHFKLEAGLLAVGGKPFPGAECEVAYREIEWRTELSKELADSEAQKLPKPAVPMALLDTSNSGKEKLMIRFTDPVNRSDVPHKRPADEILEKGLQIEPETKGVWKVSSTANALVFEPESYWIPGQQYKVTLDPLEFPELKLASSTTSFIGYGLKGSISSLDAGTVPEDRARRVVSATLRFNYPVKAESLEKLLSVNLSEKGKKGSEHSGRFSVEQGEEPTVVFVRTDPLTLEGYPVIVEFALKGSVATTVAGGAPSDLKINRTYELPSKLDIFSINGADIAVAKSSTEELQRILTLTSSEDVEEGLVTSALEVFLLPDCKEKANEKICDEESSFSDEAQITSEVEKKAEKLPVTFVSRSESGAEETFSYSFQGIGGRQILVRVNKGLGSKLGFPLKEAYREVLHLKKYPKRLNVMLDGSLLSLSGSRRLGIIAQNVKKIKYRLSRVKATDLHHLIYVSSGSFKSPELNTSFTFDDMAQPFEFVEQLPEVPSGKPAYTSVDFTRFLEQGGQPPRGLFHLEVKDGEEPKPGEEEEEESDEYYEECDGESEDCSSDESSAAVTEDSRLVLLTDLGLVVKRELAGGDRVYVASFRRGEPVAGAEVRLVSRNGNALFTATSDRNGEVIFPKAGDFTREKEPVLYVAQKDGDLTFIPYERRDRELSFSRFDVGGVVNNEEPDALRAMLFTDRGIYRPGESVQLALTVRNRDLSPLVTELPLTLIINDPRGQPIAKEIVKFPKLGIADYTFPTQEAGITGTYRAELVIPARAELPDRILSGVDFRVEEFEPDRLAVSAKIGVDDDGKFKKLEDLKAEITLKNLFGVPAVNNIVTASFVVDPWSGQFDGFQGYDFRPMLEYQNRTRSVLDLGQTTTDEEGKATFSIEVPDVSGVVLEGILAVEGFEKDSGRSVATTTRALVTDLSLLLGVRSIDALDYIDKGDLRRLDLQAINLNGEKAPSGVLKMTLEREEYKNVLVKQPNGVFKYESAKKLFPISASDLEVLPEGKTLELDTQTAGTFVMSFKSADDVLLNQVRYVVVGEGNDAIRISRNANLELSLSKPSYIPGDEIELSVKAPYAGFGFISIEREKVLTTAWFKMNTTSSVQKIKLPAGIVGNAYVTVLLARAFDSKEIYLPPLSYASLPVKIAETEYLAPPKLEVPPILKPGDQATVGYDLSERGAILVYAVDEGILQFAKYRAPEPLKALLPKRALEIETRTALDMVMPDYQIVQSVLSTGGDGGADISKFQNPFKKKNRPPLAVWSGIHLVEPGKGQFTFAIPDYFDGAVKVFAYFVGDKRVGISQTRSEIRGDFVIKPNIPTFAAPGDTFDLPVEVTNTRDTEQQATVSIEAEGLEVVGEKTQSIALKPSIGQVARFKMKALDRLGEATLRIAAASPDYLRKISEGVSVRPASPLMRTVKFGAYDPEKPDDKPEKKVGELRQMYSELRSVDAFISHSPGLLVDSLNQFMQGYPYGCSEQITSKGFLTLLLLTYTNDAAIKDNLGKQLEATVRTIAGRMNADGSIALWRRGDDGDPFSSVYSAHLMTEAEALGFPSPAWFKDGVKNFLTTKSQENQFDIYGLFTQAYALYLRARGGEVVTEPLKSMVGRLDAVKSASWKGSALSWLIGSTYALLQMNDEAKKYTGESTSLDMTQLPFPLNSGGLNAGLINYLKVKHFKGTMNKDAAFSLLNRLDNEAPDSLSASSLAIGLLGGTGPEAAPGSLKITSDKGEIPLTGQSIYRGPVELGSTQLDYMGPKERFYFYSLVESGFDRQPAKQGSRTQGVSLSRDIVDEEGTSVSKLKLGEKYTVILRIQIDKTVNDFAVQDLFPAGFEPDLDALKDRKSVGGEANAWSCENVDVRDDRIILYGDLANSSAVFSYPIKPTVRGEFVWPGLYGEAMYDSRVYAWERSASIVVE